MSRAMENVLLQRFISFVWSMVRMSFLPNFKQGGAVAGIRKGQF